MVRAIWDALTRMGFAGGNVLEPGCGTGLFLALMPEKAAAKAGADRHRGRPDHRADRRQLFPEAWIRAEDFTKARLPETLRPGGRQPALLATARCGRTIRPASSACPARLLHRPLHRAPEAGRPGRVRHLALDHGQDRGHGARAHRRHGRPGRRGADAAGRHEGRRRHRGRGRRSGSSSAVTPERPATCELGRRGRGAAGRGRRGRAGVNRYFADHPEMVLGEHARTSSPFGPVYTCQRPAGVDSRPPSAARWRACPRSVRLPAPDVPRPTAPRPRTLVRSAPRPRAPRSRRAATSCSATRCIRCIDGEPRPVAVKSATVKEGIFAKHARIMRGLIPVRDAVRAVLRAQEANEPWGTLQTRLRVAYNSFVRQFGPINHTTRQPPGRTRPRARCATRCAGRTCSRSWTTRTAGWWRRSRTTTRTATRRSRAGVQPARDPSPGRAGHHLRRRRSGRHAARGRPRRSGPGGRAARPVPRARRWPSWARRCSSTPP